MCTVDLTGLIILFDDSSLSDLTTNLPPMMVLPGQTVQVHETSGVGDIDAGGNIFFSDTRGGAALLLSAAVDSARAQGIAQLELNVSETNPRAIAFYRRHGFEVIGRDPGAEARGCSIAADAMLAGAR